MIWNIGLLLKSSSVVSSLLSCVSFLQGSNMHGVSRKYWNLTPGFEFLVVNRNAMPRTYKPDPRGKKYAKHAPKAITSTLADC